MLGTHAYWELSDLQNSAARWLMPSYFLARFFACFLAVTCNSVVHSLTVQVADS